MFHRGDFAIGNVRIPRHLRRRRNGNGNRNHDACHRGNVRHHDIGNIDVVGTLGDVGSVDVLWNAGNVGIVGNVRRWLKQYCGIVDSNVNVGHPAGRQRSSRSSVGILRGWQPWG